MKRINILFLSFFCTWLHVAAQESKQMQEPADSVKNRVYIDSLYQELPEVMITGERPIVKAEQGKLVYDVPRLVGNLPVDNAYDAVKNLLTWYSLRAREKNPLCKENFIQLMHKHTTNLWQSVEVFSIPDVNSLLTFFTLTLTTATGG